MDENLKTPETEQKKGTNLSNDFLLGLAIGLIINLNAVLYLLLTFESISWGFGAVWLVINLAVMMYFALTRRKLFHQIIKGFSLALSVVVIAGACTYSACWSMH